MLLIRMASDSRNPSAEKHQHVPERNWFLTGVIGLAFMVVNSYFTCPFEGCASITADRLNAANEETNNFFISNCL